MIDEIVNFKNAAVEAFTVSKNSLFECLHKIYGAIAFHRGNATPSPCRVKLFNQAKRKGSSLLSEKRDWAIIRLEGHFVFSLTKRRKRLEEKFGTRNRMLRLVLNLVVATVFDLAPAENAQ